MKKTPGDRLAEFRRAKNNAAHRARLERLRSRREAALVVAGQSAPVATSIIAPVVAQPEQPLDKVDCDVVQPSADRSLYPNLEDREFVLRQFADFCGRKPSEAEIVAHIKNLSRLTREQLNDEFAYCDEVVRRTWAHKGRSAAPYAKIGQHGLRVAILLTGHLRTFKKTYPILREKVVLPMRADVFVHTWDTTGLQKVDPVYGPIPDDSSKVDVAEIYRLLPEVVDARVESNSAFIARAKLKDSKPYVFGAGSGTNWKMLSAKPTHIESQLYGIYSAFQLLEQHERKIGARYDLIIKLRSDAEVIDFSPDLSIQTTDLWIPSPPDSNHGHPLCFACEAGVHEGRHATDVCDVYAYGGREAMEHYCCLWNSLESVYDRMCRENSKNITNPLASHGIRDEHVIVPIWKNGASHRLHCFYPERIFRLHLEGWRLMGGRLACRIAR
jgi:hypothetical protein